MAVEVKPPFPLFTDTAGDPVDGGYIYIGTANTDPAANPIAVFFDAALSVPASQPIRTIGGYPSRNGSAAALFCGGNYSISVRDRNGIEVFASPSAALAGGDITLASGETLTVESGATIDLEDGAALNIGDGGGTGVVVTVAANARFAGNIIPTVAGADLGSASLPWDAKLKDVNVSETATIAEAEIDSAQLNVASVFNSDEPTTNADYVKLSQRSMTLALAKQTNTLGPGATMVNISNVASITRVSAGRYDVEFSVALPTSNNWICKVQPYTGEYTSGYSVISSTVVRVSLFNSTNDPAAAADGGFDIEITGYPDVTNPF